MKRLIPIRSFFPIIIALVFLVPTPARGGDVILQWFESRWETMERRLPDAFMAGYDVLWVPPPAIADSGGFSVGYDVFDRFDFGSPFRQTLYGTDESFTRFSQELDRAGIALNIDTVLNHNGFRDASSTANDGFTNFEEAGGYPGFVTRLSSDQGPLFIEDIDGDFHGRFEGGVLNERLAGLIDIAQEKSYGFIRHPAFEDSNNIPNEDIDPNNRALYPDQDLPQEFGRFPFNVANPLEGDPTIENANGLLQRYVQWAVEVKGVDGFRLDAVKHTPTFFFNDLYDPAVFNVGARPNNRRTFHPL